MPFVAQQGVDRLAADALLHGQLSSCRAVRPTPRCRSAELTWGAARRGGQATRPSARSRSCTRTRSATPLARVVRARRAALRPRSHAPSGTRWSPRSSRWGRHCFSSTRRLNREVVDEGHGEDVHDLETRVRTGRTSAARATAVKRVRNFLIVSLRLAVVCQITPTCPARSSTGRDLRVAYGARHRHRPQRLLLAYSTTATLCVSSRAYSSCRAALTTFIARKGGS